MSTFNIPENNFQLYFKHQNMTKGVCIFYKSWVCSLNMSGNFWKFRSHCSREQEIHCNSEVIAHGNGKKQEVQKSLLTGTERTGKLRSHFLSLSTQIFVFCLFKFLQEPRSRYALLNALIALIGICAMIALISLKSLNTLIAWIAKCLLGGC